jgi:hypothetical protein
MSNKLKKEIKNKGVTVNGFIFRNGGAEQTKVNCIITNDRLGKTLTVGNDDVMFCIPFEPIEKYFK